MLDGNAHNGIPSMSITPRLSRSIQETLGDEAGEDLVNWMQQADAHGAEFREATRADFAAVRQEMHAGFAQLRHEMQVGAAELRQEMQASAAELRQEMQASAAELRQEMHAGFGRLETMIERRTADLIKWSFVFWVGAVAAVALLAGVIP